MKIRYILGLMAAALCATPAHADNIAMVKANGQDYVLEGTVVTVWDDSFLLNDGTGQLTVDIRPHNSHELSLHGQDYVQVTGHLDGNMFKPLVLSRAGREAVMFSGTATLPDLPIDEVMKNTSRYRMPRQAAPVAAPAAPAATPASTPSTKPATGATTPYVPSGPVSINQTAADAQDDSH